MDKRTSQRGIQRSTSAEEAPRRGRPRLESFDQAVDKRRTQIRLAQRAYRERKESTISQLHDRVAFLEQTIGQLNTTFQHLQEKAISSSGFQHTMNDELQNIANRSIALISNAVPKSGTGEKDDLVPPPFQRLDSGESSILLADISPSLGEPQLYNFDANSTTGSSFRVDSPAYSDKIIFESGNAAKTDNSAAQDQHLNSALDLVLYKPPDPLLGVTSDTLLDTAPDQVLLPAPDPTLDTTPDPKVDSAPTSLPTTVPDPLLDAAQYNLQPMQNVDVIPNLNCIGTDQPPSSLDPLDGYGTRVEPVEFTEVFQIPVSPELARELALPSSYSFQETSFTRRLMRASYEAAYMLLLRAKPEDMERMTTYVFCFLDKPRLLGRLEDLMGRTTRDNFELWATPFYHVGNAGLHYPREGIDSSSPPPAWWAQAEPMGPSLPRKPLNPLPRPNMSAAEVYQHTGVDGVWFDSNDIDQYLRTKGLKLDARSTVVQIVDSNENIAMQPYQEYVQLAQPHFALGYAPNTNNSYGTLAKDPFATSNDYPFINVFDDDFMDPTMNSFSATGEPIQFPALNEISPAILPSIWNLKPRRLFNVEIFIKSIVMKSACLGRTLCFRKASVDEAFELATRKVF